MKNFNTKRKTESDIRIFKDYQQCENTVYWSRGDVHAHGKIFFSAHKIQTVLRTQFLEMYPSFHQ